ncbi:hypothetical protein KM043_014573 [Ampulex compressa]|nr:hypothetical protein KM043_014573 [Ampulex compressa]
MAGKTKRQVAKKRSRGRGRWAGEGDRREEPWGMARRAQVSSRVGQELAEQVNSPKGSRRRVTRGNPSRSWGSWNRGPLPRQIGQSCRMKCPVRPLLASFLLVLHGAAVGRSQRTHARQGLGREPLIVKIPGQGSVLGKEVTLGSNQKVVQYLGIPYAKPPLGKLRFAPPVTDPLPSWTGVRNATQFGPSCQQITDRAKLHERLYKRLLPPDQPDPGLSEDCLLLNIFVPDGNRQDEAWPVMVWFHGGDFNTGTPAIWDASVFVNKQRVLVVTVAYRLNVLGFFTTMDSEAPGNYGMFDQLAALDWVQRKIEAFQGSPSNVAIYGHSSGAISVGLHLTSPLSRGKFSKAIAMSGDAIDSVRFPQEEIPVVDSIAEKFGCYRRPTKDLMECLRRVDIKILLRESSDIESWGPIVDLETNNYTEPFLPEHPRDSLLAGRFEAVPLLVGYTSNEQALAYIEAMASKDPEGKLSPTQFEELIREEFSSVLESPGENSTCELKPQLVEEAVLFFYRPHPPSKDGALLRDRYLAMQMERHFAAGLTLLAGEASKRRDAFVYRFDYRPKIATAVKDVPEWAGVPHMFDLPFAWGLPSGPQGAIQWNFADKKVADIVMTILGSFAKIGKPVINSVKWEPFTEDNPRILIVDRNVDMDQPGAVDFKALAFWNDYYPSLLEEATNNCCNVTSSSSTWREQNSNLWFAGLAIVATALPYFRV